ncbi:MAG: triose-phosphate isomerase [Alphaproteobacteria bacterium]
MAAARQPLVAGNWKMNGFGADGVALARALANRGRAADLECDVAVCPPTTLLAAVGRALTEAGGGIDLGAQDCVAADAGAFTGDISAPMLADLGCAWVIVGHSERRAGHGETDPLVREKAAAALRAGVTPIICVGESEAERDAGDTLTVVGRQVRGSLPEAVPSRVVVAYEPVWAIGTGRTPTEAEIVEVHSHIRACLADAEADAGAIRILYGGSVKPGNARAIAALEGIDGALVGGASLKAEDFWPICQSWGEAV